MTISAGAEPTPRSRVLRGLAASAVAAAALLGPQATGLAAAEPNLAAGTPNSSCPDVDVVFARGTFEAPGVGVTGQTFVDALSSRLPGKNVQEYGVNYPASLDFGAAAAGVADASSQIQSIAANCPSTKIVLGGYSQGAAVAGYTTFDAVPAGFAGTYGITGPMPPAVAAHVAAVVMFGTPDDGFLRLVDRSAPPIVVGNSYTAKTLQLCEAGDPVCFAGGLDRSAHSSYKSNGMTDQAADFTVKALR